MYLFLKHKTERKWILNILQHGLKTALDYRLYEKRFIYRQLLAIYDSRLSDHEMKLDILELIKSTCRLKSCLIDLIKKHYLVIWLTNTIIKLQQDACGNKLNSHDNSNRNKELFNKLCEISLLIWTNINETSNEIKTTPPALFIAQMFTFIKILLEYFSMLTADHDNDLSSTHGYIYQGLLKIFYEILEQTRVINKSQDDCLSTYCLTELDLKRLKKSINNAKEVQLGYFYIVIGLLKNESYLKALSKEFLMENTKFILGFICEMDKIKSLSADEEKFSHLLKSIQNLLKYFNEIQELSEGNYDSFYEISINITEILTNFNQIKTSNTQLDEFCEFFKEFLVKIKKINETQELGLL